MFSKVFILIPLLTSLYSINLLSNPDFESGRTTPWYGNIHLEAYRVFNGSYSASIKLSEDIIGLTSTYVGISVDPNTIYRASGYFHDLDMDKEIAYAYIRIEWLDVGGNVIDFEESNKTVNSASWQYLTTLNVVSPSQVALCRFVIVMEKIDASDYTKKIYFDDLSFIKIGRYESGGIEKPKNYPNPFNPRPPEFQSTTIVVPQSIAGGNLEICIYSMSGDLINIIDSSIWNGKDLNGDFVQPGIYFYVIKTSKGTAKGKMTVVK